MPSRSFPDRCREIVESRWFTWTISLAIVLNALVLGAETYESVERDHADTLTLLNDVFLGIFVVELGLRFGSYGRRPQDFFKSGWNVFDLIVVGGAFVPGLAQNATLLRIARLLRVVRLIRLLPDVQVLFTAVARSIPPILSLAALAVLLVYVYGMIGWVLFGDENPDAYGDIGQAMLTMFVMLTLENLPDNLEAGMAIHSWSWIYFLSYMIFASLLLLNLLIGVVINSMDEARAIEHAALAQERGEQGEDDLIDEQIATLRTTLAELEADLKAQRSMRS